MGKRKGKKSSKSRRKRQRIEKGSDNREEIDKGGRSRQLIFNSLYSILMDLEICL